MRRLHDFLDALCAALLARNEEEIRRLLRLPLAEGLPGKVREEAYLIAREGQTSTRPPVQTLHFYHQVVALAGALPGSSRTGLGQTISVAVIVPDTKQADEVANALASVIQALTRVHIAYGGSGLVIDNGEPLEFRRSGLLAS